MGRRGSGGRRHTLCLSRQDFKDLSSNFHCYSYKKFGLFLIIKIRISMFSRSGLRNSTMAQKICISCINLRTYYKERSLKTALHKYKSIQPNMGALLKYIPVRVLFSYFFQRKNAEKYLRIQAQTQALYFHQDSLIFERVYEVLSLIPILNF